MPESETSGVLFRCPWRQCDYETLIFPEDPADRPKWECGYQVPEITCPEEHIRLTDRPEPTLEVVRS